MITQPIHREAGFLDTGLLAERPKVRTHGPVSEFLREAGGTVLGIIQAPLRQARQTAALRPLESLDAATRRDIGL